MSQERAGKDADDSLVEFDCPGCGKEFRQSRAAVGKRTKCPRCETEFVIPYTPARPARKRHGDDRKADVEIEHEPQKRSAEGGIAKAVAIYSEAKSRRRAKGGSSMIFTGVMLMLFGGGLAVFGKYLVEKGKMKALSVGNVLGGGGLAGGQLGDITKYLSGLQDLAKDPMNAEIPEMGGGGGLLPMLNDVGGSALNQLQNQGESVTSGQTQVLWGVVVDGVGELIKFIGGIYLLAGLIGRFLRPQAEPVLTKSEVPESDRT